MIEQKLSSGLDFEILRRAIEDLDVELLADFYAEDAEVLIVNRDAPPDSPHVMRGKQEIVETYREVFEEDIRQRVEGEAIGRDRVALRLATEYPDGKRELCGVFFDLDKDGKIVRQVVVSQAWDE